MSKRCCSYTGIDSQIIFYGFISKRFLSSCIVIVSTILEIGIHSNFKIKGHFYKAMTEVYRKICVE